ncbi:MAG: polymer-forming cytoskeletal protein [Spirochaetia bacterium]|nr:polymer-forming cytoskeletal protein [Spirochaetia bacterium]
MQEISVIRTRIGPSVVINGEIVSDEELTIEGTVTANKIESRNGTLITGKTSVIKAELSGKKVTVFGKLDGNVNAQESIYIGESAVVNGDLKAPKIHLNDDAVLNGRIFKG